MPGEFRCTDNYREGKHLLLKYLHYFLIRSQIANSLTVIFNFIAAKPETLPTFAPQNQIGI